VSRHDFCKGVWQGDVNGVPVEVMALYDRALVFVYQHGDWREYRNSPPDDDGKTLWTYHYDTFGRAQTNVRELLERIHNKRPFSELAGLAEVQAFAQAFREARSYAIDFGKAFPRSLSSDERMHIAGLYKRAKERWSLTKTDRDWDDVIAYGRCLHPAEFVKWAKRQENDKFIQVALKKAEAYLDPGG
jgi:hypothetical protein